MAYHLPSLNGLRAFEAAARHMSFKAAAQELFVTPGAVSQHIKGLEESLGKLLFLRHGRGIELTEAGAFLLPVLRESFQRMSDATDRLTESDTHGPLSVSVLPSFAIKWLVHRLGKFRDLYPDYDVRLSATPELVDFSRDDLDLAIRLGTGEWPDLHSDWLMAGDLFPVCSPRLLEGDHALRTPADLKYHTLLHNRNYGEWPMWLKVHGVEGVDASRGPSFSDSGLVIEAAIDGQGVGLSRMAIAEEELDAGRVVRPFDLVIPSELAYYIVYPEARIRQPKIVVFRDWLLREAAADTERWKNAQPAARASKVKSQSKLQNKSQRKGQRKAATK